MQQACLQSCMQCVSHIRSLKEALNHGLIFKKVYRVIQFSQEAWVKPYIHMNTELRKQTKNDFQKDLYELLNDSVFGKNNGECAQAPQC